jgi:hypothetical protein
MEHLAAFREHNCKACPKVRRIAILRKKTAVLQRAAPLFHLKGNSS